MPKKTSGTLPFFLRKAVAKINSLYTLPDPLHRRLDEEESEEVPTLQERLHVYLLVLDFVTVGCFLLKICCGGSYAGGLGSFSRVLRGFLQVLL